MWVVMNRSSTAETTDRTAVTMSLADASLVDHRGLEPTETNRADKAAYSVEKLGRVLAMNRRVRIASAAPLLIILSDVAADDVCRWGPITA